MSTKRRTAYATITVFLASVFAAGPVTTHAQEDDSAAAALDEITVTGRKREESLLDVPVSITVLSAESMAAQGIYTPEQLFQATVGINFTSGFNIRINNETAVRGVRSESSLATQQTVSNFIDGMPMLGQPASLQFFGIDAVEVYRGPQSAAFGRSTFAGAINYVTADSAEEFEASVTARITDLNHSEVGLLLTGPITDTLGYRIAYWNNTNDGADEWKGTDGFLNANKETEVLSGKLNFEFSDRVHGEIFASHLEGDDGTPANWVVPQSACSSGSGIFTGGARTELAAGEWDCSMSVPNGHVPRNHDVESQFLAQYDANIAAYTAAAPGADTNGDGLVQSSEFLAQVTNSGETYGQALKGKSVVPFFTTERDRFMGNLNIDFGDNLLQLLTSWTDEAVALWREDGTDTLAVLTPTGVFSNAQGGAVFFAQTDKYVEARWISSADNKLRYTLSGSWQEFEQSNVQYSNYGPLFYGLTLPDGTPFNATPRANNSQVDTIFGVAGSLLYDISDRTTLSVEARYESAETCSEGANPAAADCLTETSLLPRFAVNHAISDNTSVYAQFSIGQTPSGVNIELTDPAIDLPLLVASGRAPHPTTGIVYDGSDGVHFAAVEYEASTFESYDAAELYNYEIGAKGSYADGRGSYTAALYYMEMTEGISFENLNWQDNTPNGWNADNWTQRVAARVVLNTGDSDYFGIELATNYAISDIWMVGGDLSLAKAEFTDFCSAGAPGYTDAARNPIVPLLSPAAGDDVLATCGVVDGNTVPFHADVTANLNVVATLPNEVFGLETSLRTDINHKGSYYMGHMNLIERSPVTQVNVSANMRNDNWALRLYVDNLTDVDDPVNVRASTRWTDNVDPTANPNSGPGWNVFPRRPREIGLQLTYSF